MTAENAKLLTRIETAAEVIHAQWPLSRFIAVNPLAGESSCPFETAMTQAPLLCGRSGFPSRAAGQTALRRGQIDTDILYALLKETGQTARYRDMIEGPCAADNDNRPALSELDQLCIKYLQPFMDCGQSAWPMPGRENGLYACWRRLAAHDKRLNPLQDNISKLPRNALDTLNKIIGFYSANKQICIIKHHLAALPGWCGAIKWRARQRDHAWQRVAPVSLSDYLAMRLGMAWLLGHDLHVRTTTSAATAEYSEGGIWLAAWEASYRRRLFGDLAKTAMQEPNNQRRADAQLVFCIDVRSEVIRRHIEAQGNYQTLGFAGFFGVPIKHRTYGEANERESCPVLISPQYRTCEAAAEGFEAEGQSYQTRLTGLKGFKRALQRLKQDIAGAFPLVEMTGAIFGALMLARTLTPKSIHLAAEVLHRRFIGDPETRILIKGEAHEHYGLPYSARLYHAEAALTIMGLTDNFAPYIVLCGHGGKVVNNPYAAALDCGACGGHNGHPNARVMTEILNEPAIRADLAERGIAIPDDTVFIGAEHNTTTDDITLSSEARDLEAPALGTLRRDLARAGQQARAERQRYLPNGRAPHIRARDWAEVRPEWGLAGNAAFIAGTRSLTRQLNLQGRCFLHSYDWQKDESGKALEVIMTAPLVVAHWINAQYYFSTIRPDIFGSASKTVQNVTGALGVMPGNGGDLMSGLPRQSVFHDYNSYYHQPLRLSALIHAPTERVNHILAANQGIKDLICNSWLHLSVLAPADGLIYDYLSDGVWQASGYHRKNIENSAFEGQLHSV